MFCWLVQLPVKLLDHLHLKVQFLRSIEASSSPPSSSFCSDSSESLGLNSLWVKSLTSESPSAKTSAIAYLLRFCLHAHEPPFCKLSEKKAIWLGQRCFESSARPFPTTGDDLFKASRTTSVSVMFFAWGRIYTSSVVAWQQRGRIYTSLVGKGLKKNEKGFT